MIPLYDAHRSFVLGANVLHADETPVNMLEPGASKTKRAYIWAYARSGFDVLPGVVYDFCVGRGAKYPVAFLQNWSGTLVCDEYTAYDIVFKLERRIEAGCLAHARRKFDELVKDNQSPVAAQAVQRIAKLYCIEREVRDLSVQQRLEVRQSRAKPLWEEMHVWLQLERQRVPDGSAIANPKKITGINTSLCGMTAAENTGYVEVPLIQNLAAACKAAGKAEPALQLYDNNANCIQAILSGRADTYINDVNTVDQAVKAYPDKLEKAATLALPYSLGIGVPRGKVEFRDAIMAALVAVQKAGIQTELLKKWGIPVENLEVPKLVVAK